MLLIYFFVTIVCLGIGRMIYRNFINPLSLYSLVWFACFFFHECGLIEFSKISIKTFLIIVLSNICVVIGCGLGKLMSKIKLTKKIMIERSQNTKKKLLGNWIIILTLVSGVDIVYKFFQQLVLYGPNIFMNFAYRYSSQLRVEEESSLDLSSLIFPLVVFLGIYIVQYGIEKRMIFPVVILALFALIQGSRGTLIIVITLFVSQITITDKAKKISVNINSKKNKRYFMLIFLLLAVCVVLITISRNQYFASSGSTNSKDKGAVYEAMSSIASYTAEGIGCLDKYMDNPERVSFPQYFFRVPIILLNKLGITELDTRYVIPTYYIPFPSNVITYIGELYHDFGDGYGIIIVIMASLFSFSYIKCSKKHVVFYSVIYSVFFTIFILSFFANFGHAASLWYVAIVGGAVAFIVDNKI